MLYWEQTDHDYVIVPICMLPPHTYYEMNSGGRPGYDAIVTADYSALYT